MTSSPPVSVVMPLLNEERHLSGAVRAITDQGYPGVIQIVLAVGPGRDDTLRVAQRLEAADSRVTVVENPSGRTPDALNAAIAASRHDIIVRVDGHGFLSPGYIARAVALLEKTGAANVGGVMRAEGETTFERAVAVAMTSPVGVGGARFHTGGDAGPAETVYLGVFRRSWLEKVGGYDPRYARAQDWEMNHRIRQAGGQVWFDPDLAVHYRPRGSFAALAKQYRDYGRWRRVVARAHKGTLNARYLAPPVTVVACTVGFLGGFVYPPLWLAPATYAAGVVVGGVYIGRRETAAVAARVPAVLATMHACWGWGFLTSRPRQLVPEHGAASSEGDAP